MDRRSFLTTVGVAGLSAGCLSESGPDTTTSVPYSVTATDPVSPPVVAGSLELDPGTFWSKPALRYDDGATTRTHTPTTGVWGYAELAIRNVGTSRVSKPPVAGFRLVSDGQTAAPVESLEGVDWASLRQREPRFGRTGYADPARERLEPDETAYCGLLFACSFEGTPALYWARDGGVTVAFSRVERAPH